MASKLTVFFTGALFFVIFGILSIHYALMKTPGQDRSIASDGPSTQLSYDASWKI